MSNHGSPGVHHLRELLQQLLQVGLHGNIPSMKFKKEQEVQQAERSAQVANTCYLSASKAATRRLPIQLFYSSSPSRRLAPSQVV